MLWKLIDSKLQTLYTELLKTIRSVNVIVYAEGIASLPDQGELYFLSQVMYIIARDSARARPYMCPKA